MELTHAEIRALQALRAPGGMTSEQAWERWPRSGVNTFYALIRRGFAAHDGETFTITAAGRAACPFANPLLAARPASQPEETVVPRGKITRQDVYNAIVAAGPAGITRKALAEKLGVSDNNVDGHLWQLAKNPDTVVRRPKRDLLVAGCFVAGTDAMPVAVPLPPPSVKVKNPVSIATGAEHTLGEAASLAAVDAMLDALPKLGGDKPFVSAPAPFSEDIELDDPEQVEFAIFSSGGLDMYTDQGNVTLGKAVLHKLRAFLGLFQEAA